MLFPLPRCPFCKAEQVDLRLCSHGYHHVNGVLRINPGTKFPGGYEIGDFIGSGGVASVYRARSHKNPEQPLVVRYHALGGVKSEEVFQRFVRGIQVIREMQSPYVPEVHDVGRLNEPSVGYAIMDYIPHPTMRDIMVSHGAKMPLDRRLRLLRFVALALIDPHLLGLVHRDVKPDNILVEADEQGEPRHVWLLDFDTVKVLEGSDLSEVVEGSVSADNSEQLLRTMLNKRLGTPEYMSPEVAAGGAKHAGPESDLYALGIMLFELITDELPFDRERGVRGKPSPRIHLGYEVCQMQITEPVMPLLGRDGDGLHEKVERLLAKLTAKKPEFRVRSAKELIRMIDVCLEALNLDKPVPAPKPINPPPRPRTLTPKPEPQPEPKPKPGSKRHWTLKTLMVPITLLVAIWTLLARIRFTVDKGGNDPT